MLFIVSILFQFFTCRLIYIFTADESNVDKKISIYLCKAMLCGVT